MTNTIKKLCIILLVSVCSNTNAFKITFPVTDEAEARVIELAESNDPYYMAAAGILLVKKHYGQDEMKIEALQYLHKAYEMKNPIGMYYYAVYGEKDKAKRLEIKKQALPGLKKMAEKEDPFAICALGYIYRSGLKGLVGKDTQKALTYYNRAAEIGFSGAQSALALIYYNNWAGAGKNNKKSFHYSKMGAAQENFIALELLGDLYRKGLGTEKDAGKAIEAYTIAAQQAGHPYSMQKLGVLLSEGPARYRNYEKARFWLEKALTMGRKSALFYLGNLYEKGLGVDKNLNKAAQYYEQGAKEGWKNAKTRLGKLVKDLEGQKNTESYYRLGMLYRSGNGVEKNLGKSFSYFLKAARGNHVAAMHELAESYALGEGTTKNRVQSIHWYHKAAEQGESRSIMRLAGFYKDGYWVQKNHSEAIRLYEKLLPDINTYAFHKLGEIYYNSSSVKRDNLQAAAMFTNHIRHGRMVVDMIHTFDQKTGLMLPFSLVEQNKVLGLKNNEIDPLLMKSVEGYKSGMKDIARDIFMEAVEKDPAYLFNKNIWYIVITKKMPATLVSSYLLGAKPLKGNDPAFWFMSAHAANLAGQPALSIKYAQKLSEFSNRANDQDTAETIKNSAAILKACALAMLGKSDMAYKVLYKNGTINDENGFYANYVNNWARPLLKDKKKLAFVTGLPMQLLKNRHLIPSKQPFHNIETGKLIKIRKQPPALQKKLLPSKQVNKVPPRQTESKGDFID